MRVTEILHQRIVTREGLAKRVAQSIGKPYPTLLRELNPFDRGAKLGVDDLAAVIKATGDESALRHIAEELGYRLEKS
ncbi:phage regulatory CII family protein [Desulfohalovibrio reitneri]|uniref:phage regulatory CII family protein n=1 Tax=Desulfohalovibrio reitneri TaxID=1307759 RepID=UPI0004A70A31|nr:phage regulatory CII family protein [Desulfohalovibrio reitneri]